MKQLICVGIKTGNQLTLRFQRPAAVTLNLAPQSTQSTVSTNGYHSIGAILADMVDIESRS